MISYVTFANTWFSINSEETVSTVQVTKWRLQKTIFKIKQKIMQKKLKISLNLLKLCEKFLKICYKKRKILLLLISFACKTFIIKLLNK